MAFQTKPFCQQQPRPLLISILIERCAVALRDDDPILPRDLLRGTLRSTTIIQDIFNTESASQGLKNSPFFRKRPKTLNPEMVLKLKKKYLRIHHLVLNPNV